MVQSSPLLHTNCGPLLAISHELTKEVCPLSFFILLPVSASHMATVLSVDAVYIVLQEEYLR